MPVKQETLWHTEADFEAELQTALRRAFPWLPAGSIQHQTRFSFDFGRARIEVDGKEQSRATGRADVLLHSGEQPLAVLELKRVGQLLLDADIAQGLSYARMLHPSPPLVAVTNGSDLVLLETHTGNEWKPANPSEAEFASLVTQAAKVATADLKQAVSILMGSDPSIWMQAIREVSKLTVNELSGEWGEQLLPFTPGFLLPRKATALALYLLRQNKQLVLIEGPPLSGKSNLLLELMSQTESADDLAVLFLESESGTGILQTLATALSNTLSWPVTRDEARDWALRLSRTAGPSLVIAVDGFGPGREDIRADVEDLTSHLFGNRVRVVITLDDSLADQLVLNSTGRKKSAIGRRSERVHLDKLDDDEFGVAAQILSQHRMHIMNGGQYSPDLRIPWVLRDIASRIVPQESYQNSKLAAGVPPVLGLGLIEHTRSRFQDHELRRMARATAQAVLEDADDRKRPISLILESMATYTVRRQTLLKWLQGNDLEKLVQRGFLRPILHESGEAVLVSRVPELIASEAADLLALELLAKATDDVKPAAEYLSRKASSIPLGDVVGAQALIDAAHRHGSLRLGLIEALIASPPEKKAMPPGTKAALYFPGAGAIDMTFQDGGSILLQAHGQRHKIESDPGDEQHFAYGNIHSYMILSHLSSRPFAIEQGGEIGPRLDPAILMEVGACPVVLRAAQNPPEIGSGILVHELPDAEIVCEKSGIVEPITLSIFWFLGAADQLASEWLDDAVERNSYPLLSRLHIALGELAGSADKKRSDFARQALDGSVKPALSAFPMFH